MLRGDHGFVCYHRGSNMLDANRSVYDVFQIVFHDGAYQIKGEPCPARPCPASRGRPPRPDRVPPAGVGGKFWYVASNGLVCSDGETSEDFFFEFREHGRVAIKGKNGKYLRGDPAGTLKADADTVPRATLWEY